MELNFTHRVKNFHCVLCNITCSRKGEFDRHINTQKHYKNSNSPMSCKKILKPTASEKHQTDDNNPEYKKIRYVCECGKKYTGQSGLWKHRQVCVGINDPNFGHYKTDIIKNNNTCNSSLSPRQEHSENNITTIFDRNINKYAEDFTLNSTANDIQALTKLVMEVVKNNRELQKQNHQIQQQMIDVCKNTGNTHIISNTNSNNKTFNLQFFLNEQCKDAMNINDFVDTFKLHFNDLEQVGKVGYVEGISDIIIKRLNAMDIYKRPIHCSDAKRDTLFVKDMNIWEKDNETNDKLRNAIKCITKKNSDMLTQWSDTHPHSRNSNSPMNNTYMSLIIQAMGGKGELVDNENRIIRKISKTVLIEREGIYL